MFKLRTIVASFAFLLFTLALGTAANAQATRTWVSGVGDDVNPCSRTAPCKTYAGAISKTAAGGEISTLDPGGFGAVTITKSIMITGTKGQGYGSVLASGTNGVIVNDSATASPNTINVTLRDLSINGAGTTLGLNGIRFLAGKSLRIEDCDIQNFSGNGLDVSVNNTVGSRVYAKNLKISNITAGNGIRMTNAAGGANFVTGVFKGLDISKVAGVGAGNGVILQAGGFATIIDANITDCVTGVNLNGGTNTVNIESSQINHNTTGLNVAAGTTARISASTFWQNNTNFSNAGTIRTSVNNRTDSASIPGVVVNEVLK